MTVDANPSPRANGNGNRAGASRRAPARLKRPRSAITSGRQLFVAGDENSAFSRRFHDLMLGHISDLGGVDLLSAAQMSLVRRMSAMEIQLEELEGRMSRGEPVDLDGRASSHLRRIYETLGLQQGRKPRDVSEHPTYMAIEYENTEDQHS
jgi:hypothetical protein